MKFRFVEFQNSIYLVVGFAYDSSKESPDCFVVTPLDKKNNTLAKALLIGSTLNIPIAYATEITDRNKLLTLMVLYG